MHLKKKTAQLFSLVLTLALILSGLPSGATALQEQPPTPYSAVSVDFLDGTFCLEFGYQNSGWIDRIQSLSVDENEYQKVTSTYSLKEGTYCLKSSDGQIILPKSLSGTVKCVVWASGYEDLVLELDTRAKTVAVAAAPETDVVSEKDPSSDASASSGTGTGVVSETASSPEVPFSPETAASPAEAEAPLSFAMEEAVGGYLKLTLTGGDLSVDGITEIQRVRAEGPVVLQKSSIRIALNDASYYLDGAAAAIYFSAMHQAIRSGDVLKISGAGREALCLKVNITGGSYHLEAVTADASAGDPYTLHVRLVGTFEPALESQRRYDAVTGATAAVTVNKNSNVEVQCALVRTGEAPSEKDWVPFHKSGVTIDRKGTSVDISPQGSGMSGVYTTLDSALTLAGTPVKKGLYQIRVTVADEQGRKATSNALPFQVYGGDEALNDQLTLEHAKQTKDGKYMYDMIPWAISKFGGRDETVTVPVEIKAWFGSHNSGTYGKLGYAVSEGEAPTQTLVIPEGCDLTLVNMDMLSSVKLVVRSGGTLRLRDSVVQGIVEVERGGTFSMNYDSYHRKFLSGASINGQLRLKDGAILKNASIYSNTNFIANGNRARRNQEAVVAVSGSVVLQGQVFIRGDEAPTGTNPKTGKSYAGQTGLSVTNGTLTLEEDALLAVYAGGMYATTSVGGTAIQLENGQITGSGTLVAVGGDGMFDQGGNGVEGTGAISLSRVFLQGGTANLPKQDDCVGGKAAADTVFAPAAVKNDGVVCRVSAQTPNIPRWSGASTIPSREMAEMTISYIKERGTVSAASGKEPPAAPAVPEGREEGTQKGAERSDPDHREKAGAVSPERPSVHTADRSDESGRERGARSTSERRERTADRRERGAAAPPATEIQTSLTAETVPAVTEAADSAAKEMPSFDDISRGDYYYDAVQWAVEKGITQGTTSSTFSPEENCTRAQIITFLWRAAGSPVPSNGTAGFGDVPTGTYYRDAVQWAVENGISGGIGPDTFGPDRNASRAEVISLLYRAAGSPDVRSDHVFADVAESSYYSRAVQWAYELGISRGTGGDRFSPDEVCTRAQILSLMHRFALLSQAAADAQ